MTISRWNVCKSLFFSLLPPSLRITPTRNSRSASFASNMHDSLLDEERLVQFMHCVCDACCVLPDCVWWSTELVLQSLGPDFLCGQREECVLTDGRCFHASGFAYCVCFEISFFFYSRLCFRPFLCTIILFSPCSSPVSGWREENKS